MPDSHWLYVTDSKLSGVGIDLVTSQQLQALSESELNVDLMARGRILLPGILNLQHPFPPTKLLSWLPSQDYYALNKRYFSWLGQRRLLRHDYSGVIAWSKTALQLFRVAEKRGIPRLLNVGNSHHDFNSGSVKTPITRWPRITRQRYLDEYELASLILLPSDHAAQTFIEQGIPQEKLRIIYRGADTTRFSPLPGKLPRPFIVASCGQVGERKGSQALLRAWRRLDLKDAELWLIGHASEQETKSLQHLLTPSVRIMGFRKDIPALLRRAHLHVLLSREEGFAKVLLEAGASGVANLCTYEAGLPPDAPGTKFIRNRDDVDEIASAIETLYNNPELALQLGQAARNMVVQQFNWGAFRIRFQQAIQDGSDSRICSMAS